MLRRRAFNAGFELFAAHMAAVQPGSRTTPVRLLERMTEAYVQFSVDHPGYFAVMFEPSLIDVDDPGYVAASDASFDGLCHAIRWCQDHGWRSDDDLTVLAAGSWALAHGLSVLRAQGSLQRHRADVTPAAMGAIATALAGPWTPPVANRRGTRRARG